MQKQLPKAAIFDKWNDNSEIEGAYWCSSVENLPNNCGTVEAFVVPFDFSNAYNKQTVCVLGRADRAASGGVLSVRTRRV